MTDVHLHIMVDLETLATGPDAAITQIAAVAFDINTSTLSHAFSGLIRNPGGRVDIATVAWWMQQKHAPELGAKLADPEQAGDEREVLSAFSDFVRLCGDVEAVWAHGATFDFPVLESAYRRHGMAVPWGYRLPRDTRTLYAVAPSGMPRPSKDETREHDAAYDCEYQIAQVCEAWGEIQRAFRAAATSAADFTGLGTAGWPGR